MNMLKVQGGGEDNNNTIPNIIFPYEIPVGFIELSLIHEADKYEKDIAIFNTEIVHPLSEINPIDIANRTTGWTSGEILFVYDKSVVGKYATKEGNSQVKLVYSMLENASIDFCSGDDFFSEYELDPNEYNGVPPQVAYIVTPSGKYGIYAYVD